MQPILVWIWQIYSHHPLLTMSLWLQCMRAVRARHHKPPFVPPWEQIYEISPSSAACMAGVVHSCAFNTTISLGRAI